MGLQGTSLYLFIILQCVLGGPTDLSCYRVESEGHYKCSWKYDGPAAGVRHVLTGCVVSSGICRHFSEGSKTLVQFTDQDINVLSNVTLWVESRLGSDTKTSPNVTMILYNWVLFDPPPRKVAVSNSTGKLRVAWQSPQIGAEVRFRSRTPSSPWNLEDCEPQVESSSESCLFPWEKDEVQEIQFQRRRRLESGAAGGPWSSWSDPVCIPPKTFPMPEVRFLEKPLGSHGTRRVTIQGQLPRIERPEGCAGAKLVTYKVRMRMASCPEIRLKRIVNLNSTLNLSGAAYDLLVSSCSLFGSGPNQTWHIPARDLPKLGTQNISVESNATYLHWFQAARHSYCIERQPQGPDRSLANCTFVKSLAGDQGRMEVCSWIRASGTLGLQECYRVTILAARHPKKLESWKTVLTAYDFGDNASEAGIPQLISVKNHSQDSVSVEWTPSTLGTCPGVLKQYVVRCQDEVSKQVSELPVPPTQTQVTLQRLRTGATYTVQVRADSAWTPGAWSASQRFRLEAQISLWPVVVACLGSFVSVLLLGGLGYLGFHRAAWHLCPPLPTPCGSSALEFPGSQGKQTWQWARPGDFPEEVSPRETLVVDMAVEKGDGRVLPQATPELLGDLQGTPPELAPLGGPRELTETQDHPPSLLDLTMAGY